MLDTAQSVISRRPPPPTRRPSLFSRTCGDRSAFDVVLIYIYACALYSTTQIDIIVDVVELDVYDDDR